MQKLLGTLLIVLLTFSLNYTFAEEQHEQGHSTEAHNDGHGDNHGKKEKFNAGEFIFDHVSDAHDWHLITWKGKGISVPLPVILYSKNSGLNVFMSNKFHHGHSDYNNFRLVLEGDNKGKIIELDSHGHVLEQLPLDFSITKNVAAIFFSLAIMLWVFLSVAKAYARRKGQAPKGLQNFIEPIIIFIRDEVAKPSIGEKKYERFLPYLLMVFFFILLNNLLGLVPIIPGGANVTGNITITMFLALCTFLVTNFSANKSYWTHIVNTPGVPWWLKFPIPIMPFVELLGIFTKPFALMIRLFANITAGHIIALAFFSLIFIFAEIHQMIGYGVSVFSIAFTVFMTCLELLVAFIQAFVFTLLSAVFIGMAIEEHH